jgi:hypothetical protein
MIGMFSLLDLKAFLDCLVIFKKLIPEIRDKNDKILSEIVDPLFARLQPLIDDYFHFFGTAIEALYASKDDNDVAIVISKLENARLAQLSNRIQVIELAKSLAEEVEDKAIRSFLRRVAGLFITRSPKQDGGSVASAYIQHWRALHRYDGAVMTKYPMIDLARTNIGVLEQRWRQIVEGHAQLQYRARAPVIRR